MLKGNSLDPDYNIVAPFGIIRLTQNGLPRIWWEPAILHVLYALTFTGDTMGWAVGEYLSIYRYYLPYGVRELFLPRMVVSPPILDFDTVNARRHATIAPDHRQPRRRHAFHYGRIDPCVVRADISHCNAHPSRGQRHRGAARTQHPVLCIVHSPCSRNVYRYHVHL